MTVTDDDIQSAVQQLALDELQLTSQPVPASPLSVDGTAGDLQVTLVDDPFVKGFRKQGLALFHDALGEEWLPIADIAGHDLILDFSGMGYTGLQQTHTAGTPVYSNFTDEGTSGDSAIAMLGGGHPLIQVFVDGDDELSLAMAGTRLTPVWHVIMQYQRSLVRPDDTINSTIYARRQRKAARADIRAIKRGLKKNRHLTVGGTNEAIDFGRPGEKLKLRTEWAPSYKEGDTWVMFGAVSFHLYGTPQ